MKFQCKWPVDTKWVDVEADWGFRAAELFVESRFKEAPMTLAFLCASSGYSAQRVSVMVDGQVETFIVNVTMGFTYWARKEVML